jgi:hypothetical protein
LDGFNFDLIAGSIDDHLTGPFEFDRLLAKSDAPRVERGEPTVSI